jgi:hypothetical protein
MAFNVISINFVPIFMKINLFIQIPLRTDTHITYKQDKFGQIYLQNKKGR